MHFKSILIISLLTLSFSGILAQNSTFYYASNGRMVESIDQAEKQKQVIKKSPKKYNVKSLKLTSNRWEMESSESFKLIGQEKYKISDKTASILSKKKYRQIESTGEGRYHFEEYYGKSLLRTGSASQLVPLHLEDTVIEYFPNMQAKSISIYKDNQLISSQNWLINGSQYFNNIFYSVDEMPLFSMGQEYFRNYILTGIQEAKIDLQQYNDNIILGWVVMEDGSIQGIHRISGKSVGLSNFIIKLIEEMPGDWEPAKLNGEVVRYYMRVPFNFSNNIQGFDNVELSGGMLIWD